MAQKTQGTVVYVETALAAAKTITGITAANPAVVTSVAHGYSNGDTVKITEVVGMQQVNNRAFVVANVAADTFQLKGCDSTDYTAYGSGGSAEKVTLSAVGEVSGIPEMGGSEPSAIDVSHLQSVATEEIAGLPKQSPISFNVWFDLATANHTTLLKANELLNDVVFKFSKPGRWNMTTVGQVGGFRITAGDVTSAYSGVVSLVPRGAGAWSLDS